MKMSKGRWENGRLYRLRSAIGRIATVVERCSCEDCDSVIVAFIDDGGDVIELSLFAEDFEDMAQAVMDFDIARNIRKGGE